MGRFVVLIWSKSALNIVRKNTNTLVINSPKKTGAYRFFIYIRDNGNNIATANIPFYVK